MRSVASWTSTDTAPYAFVPGTAKKRSATSRCTITHQLPSAGRRSRLSTTIGVATLYGRFETSLPAGGSRAARSSASASPQWSSVRGIVAQARLEPPVDLDRVHVRDAVGEEAGEHAAARADLEHDVAGVERREPLDHAEDVLVDEEVLAEPLPRRDVHRPKAASALASICAASSAGLVVANARERGERVDDVGGLVAAAADRLRREVRAVGLDEEAVGRHAGGGRAEVVRLRVRHVAGERDVPACARAPARGAPATRSSGGRRCRRRRRGRRACPRRRRACGSRPACRSSRASSSCRSNRRRCASCGA